jgi:DNA-binding NtrC family response regulator
MSPLRVLLIDDEKDLVHTLVERLRLRGIEAEGVLNGDDALARLAEEEFDVVVQDLKMPGLSGPELLDRIRKQRPGIPVIVITGYGATRDGEEAIREGAFDYLAKPFDIKTLIRVMKASVQSQ